MTLPKMFRSTVFTGFFALVLLAGCGNLEAQRPRVQVVATDIQEKSFSGKIASYPITMHLQFEELSPEDWNIYSVSGWYYYDRVKTKIPLCGIYNGNLTLYVFSDSLKWDTVLNFIDPVKMRFWESVGRLRSLEGYDEKMEIEELTSGSIEGVWKNGEKELKIGLEGEDLSVSYTENKLNLYSNVVFDLNQIRPWFWNYKLEAYSPEQKQVLLSFEYPSRSHVMGRCGAGQEKGFLRLKLDPEGKLLEDEEIATESCLEGILFDELESTDDAQRIFSVYQHYPEEKEGRLTLNLKQASWQFSPLEVSDAE
ncbi:hypothetical protein KFE98_03195 [bacterium SCSIO 12741]|nr:hypothetical protein KFE98_03195 [bacterium SCSIO 12741]